jgi:hypothetical protein
VVFASIGRITHILGIRGLQSSIGCVVAGSKRGPVLLVTSHLSPENTLNRNSTPILGGPNELRDLVKKPMICLSAEDTNMRFEPTIV